MIWRERARLLVDTPTRRPILRTLARGKRPGHTGGVAQDNDTLSRINALVAEEKELRLKVQRGEISEDEEHSRLRVVETELDQCWDLLRQRRALRETGGDPHDAQVRPPDQVEGYLN